MSVDLTNAQITQIITGFKEGHEGKYWNKYPKSIGDESPIGKNDWGLTDVPCGKPCRSNAFGGGIQCQGFAKFITYLIFGTCPNTTTNYNGGSAEINNGWHVYQGDYTNVAIEPGDFIRVEYVRDGFKYQHSFVVWKVEGDNVEVIEVFGSKGCLLHWGAMNEHDDYSTVSAIKTKGMTKFIAKYPRKSDIETPPKVKVKFQSTEDSAEVKEYTPGEPYGTLPTASRADCEFLGWYTEGIRVGTPEPYTTATEVQSSDHTLFAHWRAKVTFQPNDGSSSSTVNVDFGIGNGTLTVPQNPSRIGYNFKGWRNPNTKTTYTYGQSMPVTGNVTLIAEWEIIEYTVTHAINGADWVYDRNGQITMNWQDKVVHGANYVVGFITARKGYKFIGWQYGGRLYLPGEAIPNVTSDLTLTAQWEELTVCLNFDTDGDGVMEPLTLTYSQVVEAGGSMDLIPSSLVPKTSEVMFTGWQIKNAKNADDNKYFSLPGFKNYDLKATFTKKCFSVRYNANGGDLTPATQIKEAYKPIILSRQIPCYLQDYYFIGWSEDKNGMDAPVYLPGQEFTGNRDVLLYAVYRVSEFCIRYDLMDDEYDGPAPQLFTQADIASLGGIRLSNKTPKRDGYRFVKWRSFTEEGSVDYQPGDLYTKGANLYLRAVWEKVYMTVTLRDLYNGSNITDQYKVKQGSAYKWNYSDSLTNPSVYTYPTDSSDKDYFRGYFMGYTDGYRIIHGDELVTLDEDHSLVAKWIPEAPFEDIYSHSYAKEAIDKCYYFGYIFGVDEYLYNPSGPVKRGDAALILSRMIKLPAVGNNWFYDVPTSGSNYLKSTSRAVTWAKDWNILSGTNGDLRQFGTEKPITRQDLVVMLYRFVKSQGMALQEDYDIDLSAYTDANQISNYAVPAMKWALATKMIAGTSSTTLSPKDEVNRAQMAVFMLRLRRLLIKEGLLEDVVEQH